jgi:hypothetical protein
MGGFEPVPYVVKYKQSEEIPEVSLEHRDSHNVSRSQEDDDEDEDDDDDVSKNIFTLMIDSIFGFRMTRRHAKSRPRKRRRKRKERSRRPSPMTTSTRMTRSRMKRKWRMTMTTMMERQAPSCK